MKVVVGLGNPGARYDRTRHNLGFRVMDALYEETRAGSWSTICQSLVCTTEIAEQQVLLAKPLTFMNLSGRAIRLLMSSYRLNLGDVLLVCDDLNLPFGKIRIRERGSAGGHHGVDSVLRALESDEVARVRLGIGEDNLPDDKAQFVLSGFPADKESEVNEMIKRTGAAVRMVIAEGIDRAMSFFNA